MKGVIDNRYSILPVKLINDVEILNISFIGMEIGAFRLKFPSKQTIIGRIDHFNELYSRLIPLKTTFGISKIILSD
jgi:hypothetical protein